MPSWKNVKQNGVMSENGIKAFATGIIFALLSWIAVIFLIWFDNVRDGIWLSLNDIDLPYLSISMTILVGFLCGGFWPKKPIMLSIFLIHFFIILLITLVFFKSIPFENGTNAPFVMLIETYLKYDNLKISFILMHLFLFLVLSLTGLSFVYFVREFKNND